MRNILSRANREVLHQFAWSKVLMAFDYDGTLAPIVAGSRQGARMRKTTRRLLRGPLEALSLHRRLRARAAGRGASPWCQGGRIVGNHGIEPWQAKRLANEVRRWGAVSRSDSPP